MQQVVSGRGAVAPRLRSWRCNERGMRSRENNLGISDTHRDCSDGGLERGYCPQGIRRPRPVSRCSITTPGGTPLGVETWARLLTDDEVWRHASFGESGLITGIAPA